MFKRMVFKIIKIINIIKIFALQSYYIHSF